MGAKWWLRWGHNETPLMDPAHYRPQTVAEWLKVYAEAFRRIGEAMSRAFAPLVKP